MNGDYLADLQIRIEPGPGVVASLRGVLLVVPTVEPGQAEALDALLSAAAARPVVRAVARVVADFDRSRLPGFCLVVEGEADGPFALVHGPVVLRAEGGGEDLRLSGLEARSWVDRALPIALDRLSVFLAPEPGSDDDGPLVLEAKSSAARARAVALPAVIAAQPGPVGPVAEPVEPVLADPVGPVAEPVEPVLADPVGPVAEPVVAGPAVAVSLPVPPAGGDAVDARPVAGHPADAEGRDDEGRDAEGRDAEGRDAEDGDAEGRDAEDGDDEAREPATGPDVAGEAGPVVGPRVGQGVGVVDVTDAAMAGAPDPSGKEHGDDVPGEGDPAAAPAPAAVGAGSAILGAGAAAAEGAPGGFRPEAVRFGQSGRMEPTGASGPGVVNGWRDPAGSVAPEALAPSGLPVRRPQSAPSVVEPPQAQTQLLGPPGPGMFAGAVPPPVSPAFDPFGVTPPQPPQSPAERSQQPQPSGRQLGRLVMENGPDVVVDGDCVIGRNPEVDPDVARGRAKPIILPDAEQRISRIHARLLFGPDGVEIVDAGSVNGTWIEPPDGDGWIAMVPRVPAPLPLGSRIQVGDLVLSYAPVDDES